MAKQFKITQSALWDKLTNLEKFLKDIGEEDFADDIRKLSISIDCDISKPRPPQNSCNDPNCPYCNQTDWFEYQAPTPIEGEDINPVNNFLGFLSRIGNNILNDEPIFDGTPFIITEEMSNFLKGYFQELDVTLKSYDEDEDFDESKLHKLSKDFSGGVLNSLIHYETIGDVRAALEDINDYLRDEGIAYELLWTGPSFVNEELLSDMEIVLKHPDEEEVIMAMTFKAEIPLEEDGENNILH